MSGSTALGAIGQKLASMPIQPLLAVGIVMTLIGFDGYKNRTQPQHDMPNAAAVSISFIADLAQPGKNPAHFLGGDGKASGHAGDLLSFFLPEFLATVYHL